MLFKWVLKFMSLLFVIKNRRSVYQFLNQTVSSETLNTCFEAAIWAPNHKLRQPWIFWQVGQESKNFLSQIYAEHRASKKSTPQDSEWPILFDKAQAKFMAIPQVVLVGQKLIENPVDCLEDYAACACAIQNFQLMASDLGLGVQWSTGPIINDARVYDFLNVDKTKIKLIAALYMGYPDGIVTSCRKPLDSALIQLD